MDNFKDTAYRMYEDTEILLNNNKWFNSCYLSGYVLECYCKLILDNAITNGIVSGRGVRSYSHRVADMEGDITMVSLSPYAISKYCLDLNSTCVNLINGWNPNNRYNSNGSDWDNKAKAENCKKECDLLIEEILKMELDGVI